jgi:uncharacterized protein YbjT (DUF2867 family)
MKFFKTSTHSLLTCEAAAGVGHHVMLSVVGTERLLRGDYLRAKFAQEKLIKESPIPYSIIQATQLFEFLRGIRGRRYARERRSRPGGANPADRC